MHSRIQILFKLYDSGTNFGDTILYFLALQNNQKIICFSIIKVSIHVSPLNIVSIKTFAYLLKNPALLLIILVCFIMYTFSTLLLEVHCENIIAISLYFWLGFSLCYKRLNYYGIYTKSSHAYTLINYKHLSKNRIRRFLLLD